MKYFFFNKKQKIYQIVLLRLMPLSISENKTQAPKMVRKSTFTKTSHAFEHFDQTQHWCSLEQLKITGFDLVITKAVGTKSLQAVTAGKNYYSVTVRESNHNCNKNGMKH